MLIMSHQLKVYHQKIKGVKNKKSNIKTPNQSKRIKLISIRNRKQKRIFLLHQIQLLTLLPNHKVMINSVAVEEEMLTMTISL